MRTTILLFSALILAAQDRPRGGFMRSPLLSALDTDHDGVISEGERAAAPQSLARLDRNSDGKLTAEELRPAFGPGGPARGSGGEAGAPGMTAMLMRFDANGDGVLDSSEVPGRMQGIFGRGDRNQDGKLTRDEVEALAQAQPRGSRERPAMGGNGPGGPARDPLGAAIDADGDGTISASELAAAPAAIAKLDRNGDGVLEADEIRPAFGPGGRGGDPAQMMARMIGDWDQDGDGKLSRSETPERMREGFDAADLDHDGKLSREELGKMMQQRFENSRRREQ